MRKTLGLALVFAAAVAGATTPLPSDVQDTLTTIDQIPTQTQINRLFGNDPQQALANLSTIALTEDADPAVRAIRLRAIHALSHYCTAPCGSTDVAHQTLVALITAERDREDMTGDHAGYGVLVLRAALEALGPQQVATDEPTLAALLNHPSRDIRAITAYALRDLGNCSAITPLRARIPLEPSEQVKLAISDALRILGQPAVCP